MGYYAQNFIFDGVPSEKFDVFICQVGGSSQNTEDGGGNVKIHTDKTSRMDYNYLLGVEHEEEFEFTMTFGSKKPKDRFDVSLINNWLIGRESFKKLLIIQPDMSQIYFNCILTDFKITTFRNLPQAFEVKVVCDRGWALELEKTYNYNITSNPQIITHNNTSHKNGLTLPKIEILTNASNATVNLKNKSNDNWTTTLTGLAKGETVYMDSESEQIVSSTGTRRLSNFNKHWFELARGINQIEVSGNVANIKIKYERVRKVGA